MNTSAMTINKKIFSDAVAQRHGFINILGIIPAAFAMTTCLLYAMYLLVHKDYPLVAPKPVPLMPEVFMTDTVIEEFQKEPPPVRPIEQLPPPPMHKVEPVEVNIEGDPNFRERIITLKPPINDGLGLGGQMVPFIKIAPQYPTAAATKGIEGYVDVMFDVTELGSTDNIRIVGYLPSTVFNKSVIKAVKGWKYKPNEVDGVAVRTFDVKDRIRFAMEK